MWLYDIAGEISGFVFKSKNRKAIRLQEIYLLAKSMRYDQLLSYVADKIDSVKMSETHDNEYILINKKELEKWKKY